MKKTIEDLFNGKIVPCEQKHVHSEKYMAAVKRLVEVEERLFALLDDSGREVWVAYQDAQADATVKRNMANFEYGFRLAMRLVLGSLDSGSNSNEIVIKPMQNAE